MEANLITIILLLVIIGVLVYMIYHKDVSSNKSAFNTNTTTTAGNIAVPTMMDKSDNVIVQPAGYYYDGYPNEDPYVYDYQPEYYYDPLYWWGGWYGSSGNYRNYRGRNRHWGNHHSGGHHGISSGAIAHGYGGGMGYSGGGHR
jgi:hypothetical protein